MTRKAPARAAPGRRSGRELEALLKKVRACRVCEAYLPFGPRPVLRAAVTAQLVIVGQAPGRRVHETGIPWNDPSGDRLRDLAGARLQTLLRSTPYRHHPGRFLLPGHRSRRRLAAATGVRAAVASSTPGTPAEAALGAAHRQLRAGVLPRRSALTETVRSWRDYLPYCIPLPHPSPRNQMWFKRNPWFADEVIPFLRRAIHQVLDSG